MFYAVILCGGSGTRLWPESRQNRAKQFLSFNEDGQTMFAAAVRRLQMLIPVENVRVLTGQMMIPQINASVPDLKPEHILAEPAARNTAPCIGWAAAKLLKDDPDAVMVVLPSDHVIQPADKFCHTLQFAAELVAGQPELLITLGIKPSFASTSYGYIQRGEPLRTPVAEKWKTLTVPYSVVRFHEKPEQDVAEQFVASGKFNWNAGIFVWKAKTVLDLLHRFEPEIGAALDKMAAAFDTPQEQYVLEAVFPAIKKISIDYAVMERAERIAVLDAAFSWDDVGTWCSLDRLYADKKDAAGNLAIGTKVIALNSRNNIVRGSDAGKVIALLGLNDIVVVQTADATLIVKKDQEESVRNVIDELKKRNWNDFL
ncbi:MAG: NTP transferase domain-containing protein [Planctomycetaceae bacterium]|jgi:mannose-1-phosphate guanylyltransferase|nr:NTP transferase domain-containing protein [Planctomycetaceae bacterium]